MRFEHGSEVIGSSTTFFATNLIPAANPGKVAESVNVFKGLLSEILFWQTKRINPLTLLARSPEGAGLKEAFCICVFFYVSFRYTYSCSFGLLTSAIKSFLLSHKLRCYTGISGSEKSRNNTREKISYLFTCVIKPISC